MKVIQRVISKNKANKNAFFFPISSMPVGFLSETFYLRHIIQFGTLVCISLDKTHPNWTRLYDFEKSQATQICGGFLAYSSQKAVGKSPLETPPWLSTLHLLAAARAPCTWAVHRWWPSPSHLRVIAVTIVGWCTELRAKWGLSQKGDDHPAGNEAAWQKKWSWKPVVGRKR